MDNKIEILVNDKNQTDTDFYATFKQKLENAETFPTNYIFKFILPSDQSKIARLYGVFENADATISYRESKTGKYSSFTIKTLVNDADEVIHFYKQMGEIEGVVML